MKVLVTGSSGFVGNHLCPYLRSKGLTVFTYKSLVPNTLVSSGISRPTIIETLPFLDILSDIDVVIHLAGRAHVMNERASDPLLSYKVSNAYDSLFLASQCHRFNVKKFIYLSSAKVFGEFTADHCKFNERSPLQPVGPYSQSKCLAEQLLARFSNSSSMDIISIRPPLIYGPNVKGNLKLLVKLLQKSIPLPFKNIRSNHRSFVSVFNLVDFLYHLTVSSNSIAGPLVVSDGHDLSTFELVHQLSLPLNCQPNLFSFSRRLSSSLCVFPKFNDLYNRLYQSFRLDPSHSFRALDWFPPYSVHESFSLSFRRP